MGYDKPREKVDLTFPLVALLISRMSVEDRSCELFRNFVTRCFVSYSNTALLTFNIFLIVEDFFPESLIDRLAGSRIINLLMVMREINLR